MRRLAFCKIRCIVKWVCMILYCDAAENWQLNIQDPATPALEGMLFFHNYLLFFLITIVICIFSYFFFKKEFKLKIFLLMCSIIIMWHIIFPSTLNNKSTIDLSIKNSIYCLLLAIYAITIKLSIILWKSLVLFAFFFILFKK